MTEPIPLPNNREALIRRLRAGEMDDVIARACRVASRNKLEAEALFSDIYSRLEHNNFEALAAYNSQLPPSAYIGLVIREILTADISRLLGTDPDRGWYLFLRFFDGNIRKRIDKHFQNKEDGSEAYIFILERLSENKYAKLREFKGVRPSGEKSIFAGFVNKTILHLCQDFARRIYGRPRLPACIKRLSLLDQLVFIQIYWEGVRPRPIDLLRRLNSRRPEGVEASEVEEALRDVTLDKIDRSIDTMRMALPRNYSIGIRRLPLGKDITEDGVDKSREERIAELAKKAYDALIPFIRQLDEKKQLYVRYILTGTRPRGRPPTRFLMELRQELEAEAAKNPDIKAFLEAIRDVDRDSGDVYSDGGDEEPDSDDTD